MTLDYVEPLWMHTRHVTLLCVLQVRLHSELSPEELSGAGAEGLSFTAPPDMPLGPMGLPTGLEALVQQQGRKVPPAHQPQATPTPHYSHQTHQPQAQESVVVAELSPTPWQDKVPSPANPFAGLQHILAADLRTLLRNEEDSVDRLRLQKNIDNWTAQVRPVSQLKTEYLIYFLHAGAGIENCEISLLFSLQKFWKYGGQIC